MASKINYQAFYRYSPQSYQDYIQPPSISIFFHERNKLFLKEFKKFKRKKEGVRVLDVGCGWGSSIFPLSEISDKNDFFLGIDVNKHYVEFSENKAKAKKVKNAYFKRIDISKQDWENQIDGVFDIIIFSETIEHLYPQDQNNALKNISQKLAKDGILIITCPNKNCLIKKVIKKSKEIPYFGKIINISLKGSVGHVAELSYSELRKKTSRYFDKVKQGGLTFSYGQNVLDRSTFTTLSFIFSNIFFRYLLPFWCFDQYIILKNKR